MRTLCLSLALALTLSLAPALGAAEAPSFEVQKLAEGVYAVIRAEPPGFAVDANNLFVVNDEDVVVVDANVSLSSTREVLAALRKITDKPVRYVINTHWHDDHIVGNQVYRDAFPGVEFVAHARVREYLQTAGVENRKQMATGVHGFVAFLKGTLEKNESPAGGPLDDEERATYASDLRLAQRYAAEVAGFQNVMPTIEVEDRLAIRRGDRTIEVRAVGRGHTAGDLVVHLPKERIVVAGDLVVWPVPLVGGNQSHVGEWGPALERLLALEPAVIVPGHGPILRDHAHVKLLASMFVSIDEQTRAAVARGETLEAAQKSVKLDDFRAKLAGASRVRRVLFSSYTAGPAVVAAYGAAKAR
jgi:cyclase